MLRIVQLEVSEPHSLFFLKISSEVNPKIGVVGISSIER